MKPPHTHVFVATHEHSLSAKAIAAQLQLIPGVTTGHHEDSDWGVGGWNDVIHEVKRADVLMVTFSPSMLTFAMGYAIGKGKPVLMIATAPLPLMLPDGITLVPDLDRAVAWLRGFQEAAGDNSIEEWDRKEEW